MTGVLLLWVLGSAVHAASAIYSMTHALPHVQRQLYREPTREDRLVREPFTDGPRAIALSCLSVVALWLWLSLTSGARRRPRLLPLVLGLVGFLCLAALIAPQTAMDSRNRCFSPVGPLRQTLKAAETYRTEGP